MYSWPLAKQKQAEFCPRFPNLLKFLLWTKGIELVKTLNALGPLCLFLFKLFCSRVQNFCCRFLFLWYCLWYAVGWQSASLKDAKRPCSSSMLFVKLLIDCFFFQSWTFLIVLQMQEDLTHLQWRPLTVGLLWTMDGPKDQPAQMIWSPIFEIYVHITKKSPFHQLQKGKASLTSAG